MNWDKSCNDSFHAMLLSCIDSFSKGKQVLRNVKSVLNPSCPVKVQSKSKENQDINQKEKNKKKRIREKTPKKSVRSVSVFLI